MANIHEGTRRLALFSGIVAALAGVWFAALVLASGPLNAENLAWAIGAPIVGYFSASWLVRSIGWVIAGFFRVA